MKKSAAIIFFICLSLRSMSQIYNPVKWSFATKEISNNEVVIFLKATIDDGWHIYSVYQKDGGPLKTSFAFDPSRDYELNGKLQEPKPIKGFEDAFNMDVFFFQKVVVFQQKIKLIKETTMIKGELRYMAC